MGTGDPLAGLSGPAKAQFDPLVARLRAESQAVSKRSEETSQAG